MMNHSSRNGIWWIGIAMALMLAVAIAVPQAAVAAEHQSDKSDTQTMDKTSAQNENMDRTDSQKMDQARSRETNRDQSRRTAMESRTDGKMDKEQFLMGYRGLVGREIRNNQYETIGEIDNVVVGPDGKNIQAIVSVGGFWGIGDEQIIVPLDRFNLNSKRGYVFFNGTEDELESFPEYEEPDWRIARRMPRRGGPADYPRAYGTYWDNSRDYGYYGRMDERMRDQPYDSYYRGDNRQYGSGYGPYRHHWARNYENYPMGGPMRRGYYQDEQMRRDDNMRRGYQREDASKTERMYGNQRYSYGDPTWRGKDRTHASELIGKNVRNAKDETIGEVEDLIVSSDGRVDLVISVGGFLGIGDKKVRADLQDVEIEPDFVFYDISERELENQPAFTARKGDTNQKNMNPQDKQNQ